MSFLPNILFAIVLFLGIGFFVKNVKKLIRNIKLGQDVDRFDNSAERWKNMAMIALGQSKMVKRPIAGFLHILVYVGFIIINIEVLEIIIDGLLTNTGANLTTAIEQSINKFCLRDFKKALRVLISPMGETAKLVGAKQFVFDQLIQTEFQDTMN